MHAAGLRGEEPVAIYSTNDARVLFCMLGLLRAGGVWVPINYRNAADANVEYLNYVRTKWLFYHSTLRDHAKELKHRVPTLRHLICIDAPDNENPSLEEFMQQGSATNDLDTADAYGNLDRLVGLVPDRRHHWPSQRRPRNQPLLGHHDGNGLALLARRHRPIQFASASRRSRMQPES